MNKKDFFLVTILGVAIGLLIQPMVTTLADTIRGLGFEPNMNFRIIAFLGLAIFAPFALWIAHLLGRVWGVLYQFAKFGAIGTLNTMIDFGVFNLFLALTGFSAGIGFSVIKGISFLVATTNSFFWNKFWTFESKDKASVGQTGKFYAIAIIGWGLNVGSATWVANLSHGAISDNLWANFGALVGVGASFLWNFLGYKFFVFAGRKDTQAMCQNKNNNGEGY